MTEGRQTGPPRVFVWSSAEGWDPRGSLTDVGKGLFCLLQPCNPQLAVFEVSLTGLVDKGWAELNWSTSGPGKSVSPSVTLTRSDTRPTRPK